jgi:hypothetical protein
MSRDDRVDGLGQVAVDDVKVRAADRTGLDPDADLPRTGFGFRPGLGHEAAARLPLAGLTPDERARAERLAADRMTP